jgi:hypothetical protein
MGARPGQVPQEDVGGPGSVKVYASAYSQIPVFEAMIRNISVMRRMADSWVNATQILKVAGISKSVRTKILEKQVQTQAHEKVQGGCECYCVALGGVTLSIYRVLRCCLVVDGTKNIREREKKKKTIAANAMFRDASRRDRVAASCLAPQHSRSPP